MFLKIKFYFLCFKVDNFVFSTCNVYFFWPTFCMFAPLNKRTDYENQVEALQHQTFCLEWNFTQKQNLKAISEIYTSFVVIVVDYCKYRRIYIFMLRFCQMFTKALEFIIKSVKKCHENANTWRLLCRLM
jgi:hypothetical protein